MENRATEAFIALETTTQSIRAILILEGFTGILTINRGLAIFWSTVIDVKNVLVGDDVLVAQNFLLVNADVLAHLASVLTVILPDLGALFRKSDGILKALCHVFSELLIGQPKFEIMCEDAICYWRSQIMDGQKDLEICEG